MKLEELRQEIDGLDAKIMKLLGERMEKAILTKRLKQGVLDSQREAQVLERVRAAPRGLLEGDFTVRLYQQIMEESRRLQGMDFRTVGFLGEHGSNSELACQAWDPGVVPIPSADFSEILANVESGLLDYGMLPVENTSGGYVGPANNLLIYTKLSIISAIDMPIPYCLMAAPGVDYREIRKVYSHPQSLLQCRDFIARAKLEPIPEQDSASAAKRIAETRPADAACISNSLCAELYGLSVIKEDVQDLSQNRTRFFVLAKEASGVVGKKSSIVFTTENKAGALFRTLEVFAKAGINLTRIESVPDLPGEYAIFIDLVGSDKDPKVAEALNQVSAMTARYRMLGCYEEKVL